MTLSSNLLPREIMGPRVFFFSHGISQAFLEDEGQFLFDAAELIIFVAPKSHSVEAPKKLQTCQTKKNRMKSLIVFFDFGEKLPFGRHTKQI